MTEDDWASKRSRYRPAQYWTDRLSKDFSLRGVGHQQYSEGYNNWIYRQKRRALDGILPSLRAGGRALDVGSGVGWVVEELRARGWTTDGADISPVAVDRLRQRFPGATFMQVALGNDPVPAADAAYDLITILDVTYHVVDDELWSAGLSELARVLKPGGHLVVIDRFGATDDDAAPHVRFRSRQRWETAARSCGLTLQTVQPVYRWLSREYDKGLLSRVPEKLRGPAEFALERVPARQPHMRGARFVRG